MTVKTIRKADPSQPLPGQRLELATVAADLGLSFADMAAAAGISKTAMSDIATENRWPKRQDMAELQAAIRALFAERGAKPEQLEILFWARTRRTRAHNSVSDIYGRARDHVPGTNAPRPQPLPTPKATDMLLAKQSLSYEASKAFTLFTNPFDGEVTTAEELFHNGELRFVREAMWQAGKNGRFVAVVGESGAGKTTLLGDLEDRILRDRAPVIVVRPSVMSMTDTQSAGRLLKAGDIIQAIMLTIDPQATVPATHEARSRKMLKMVEESAKVGNSHLLVIEEAHALPIATAKALKRLHEACRIGRRAALGILLLGQPELLGKLNERRADMREVVQRCEVVQLPPLDGDLRGYLAHKAGLAGRNLAELIDESGIEEMRNRLTVQGQDRKATPISLLYPLAINNLMTACLNVAASLGVPVITRDVVRAV